MFHNAGAKIKRTAIVLFILTVLVGSVTGIVKANQPDSSPIWLLLIPGSVAEGWISCLCLYAFGDLCEDTALLRERFVEYADEDEAEETND